MVFKLTTAELKTSTSSPWCTWLQSSFPTAPRGISGAYYRASASSTHASKVPLTSLGGPTSSHLTLAPQAFGHLSSSSRTTSARSWYVDSISLCDTAEDGARTSAFSSRIHSPECAAQSTLLSVVHTHCCYGDSCGSCSKALGCWCEDLVSVAVENCRLL
jgi:hypothetical protein